MFKLYKRLEKNIFFTNRWLGFNLGLLFIALFLNASVAFAQTSETLQKTMDMNVSPERLSTSFAKIAKKVGPAVVSIDTKIQMPDIEIKGNGSGQGSNDLNDLFRWRSRPRPSYAVGSGFLVSRDGYIITNFHVVKGTSRITVRIQSGEEFMAKIVGADEPTDLAVLKIDPSKDLPMLEFEDSKSVRIGDWVLAIGSPFGLEQTVTAGIISQTKRNTPSGGIFQQFIQTDAAINRGNSGGPLVNMNGKVIGVNSQIATSTGNYNGIGFALPSNKALNVYRQILRNGKVRRGYLGVLLESVKKEFAKVYKLEKAKGVIITDIYDKEGAAAKAGILKDDIIIKLNDIEIENSRDFIEKIASVLPGKNVNLTLLRESGASLIRQEVNVKLGERPTSETVSDYSTRRKLPIDGKKVKEKLPFGLTLVELNSQTAQTYGFTGEKGLLIRKIDPNSFIADVKNTSGRKSISKSDLIQRINRKKVLTLEDFNKIVSGLKKGDPVVLHVLKYDRGSRRAISAVVQFTVK